MNYVAGSNFSYSDKDVPGNYVTQQKVGNFCIKVNGKLLNFYINRAAELGITFIPYGLE